jgi:hypothetical protein
MLDADSIQIGSVTAQQMRQVFDSVLSIDVSYSITESTQITVKFIDPEFRMGQNNYFTVGRDIIFSSKSISPYLEDFYSITPDRKTAVYGEFVRRSNIYEMASVSVDQSAGNSPVWTVKARPKGVQQMKRDRKPKNIKGSGSRFVINACKRYGLEPVTQRTNKSYKINNAQGAQQATSVWDAMKSIAEEAEFVMFEVDGFLYFGQEKWILNKWGTHASGGNSKFNREGRPILDEDGVPQITPIKRFIPFYWPPDSSFNPGSELFRLIGVPTVTQSDNDAYVADGSLVCERTNGVRMRPGMTVKIFGVPNFQGSYLVTEVSFKEEATDPVAVTFRSPEKLEKDRIRDIQIGKRVDSVYKITPGFKEVTVPTPVSRTVPGVGILPVNPLPTASQPMIYPEPAFDPSFVAEQGNISLWNRPVFDESTSQVFIYFEVSTENYVVLEKIWCISGVAQKLTESAAIDKYLIDDLHYGVFTNENAAKTWRKQLISAQDAIVEKRFKNLGSEVLRSIAQGFCP